MDTIYENPAIGFAIAAAILIPVGRAIGFLEPGHLPRRWASLGFQYAVILAATALPEEILFRGLIQNSLMQRLGAKTSTLLLAALIFGCAHLDNGPGSGAELAVHDRGDDRGRDLRQGV